nr:hypothetical protein [uncultured Albidiferax sp.]
MMRYLKVWALVLLALVMAACGGGGNPGGTSSGGGTTTPPSPASPSITLSLVDSAGAALGTPTISKGGVYYAKAVAADASGAVLANQLVTFSTDYAVATLAGNTAGATVLTDASGVARVLISPLSLTTTGAAILSASATLNSVSVTKTLNFGTAASNVSLSNLTSASSSIGALETSAISVSGAINGNASSGVLVAFNASCGTFSPASVATSSNGLALSTYQSAATCGGNSVTITASAAGATDKTTTISVVAAKPANIRFTSSVPALMYVSSAASGAKTSIVKFQVLDSSAAGMPSQSVTMSLSTAAIAAGVKFSLSGSSSTAPQTVTTDNSGFAAITVASGTLPTTVSVTATLVADPTVLASSLGLVVTTGAATQNAASLSASKLSIEAWSTDGVTSTLTMRVADRLSNPVPDGTSVNFVASAGLISGTGTGGSCLTVNSACLVTYTSQGTRPVNGRVAILAYLDGEESFVDVNGDNVWNPDGTEDFYDAGTAFIDLNENGTWQSGEQIIGVDVVGLGCVNPINTYPAKIGTCDQKWSSAIRVRKQTIITLATSSASITRVSPRTASGFRVWVHDTNINANINGNVPDMNAMPTGSTFSAAISTAGATCTVVAASPNLVLNSPNGDYHDVILSGAADCVTVQVNVSVTTPGGTTTTQPF